jgi:hypothetical protein
VESNSGNNTPFGLYNYNVSANGSDLGYVTTFIRNNGNTGNIQWPNLSVNERTTSAPVIVATAFPGSGSADTDSYIQLNGNSPNLRTMFKVASTVNRFSIGYTIRPSPAQAFLGYMQENLLWEADLRSDISDIIEKENNYYQHY